MFVCTKCNIEVATSLSACPLCGAVVTTDFLRTYSESPLDGKYQMLSLLGVGGMGEVYKAMHVHLRAPRVIKLMRAKIAGQTEARERFLREARLATRIQHPNVAALFDFSELPDGSFYMVWEFIDGVTLQKYVAERDFLKPQDAVRLAVQALMGLEAIHRAGIVHRDVSPENLMVTRDEQGVDRIKIIDLGVAKQWNDEGEGQTRTGIFVGKFKYCSPEQLGMLKKGERIDGRADLYSFGLVLYEMLTGVAPFQAETPHEYVLMQSAKMPQPLRAVNPRVTVSPALESIIFRSVQKERERRFANALEFAKALESALPSVADTIASTIDLILPRAESVADTAVPSVEALTLVTGGDPTVVSQPAAVPAPRAPVDSARLRPTPSWTGDTAGGRKRDLFEQVVAAMGEEQYGRADAAIQTLRMHLGMEAETDTGFRRLLHELEAAAADKESWFRNAIDAAKQRSDIKEMQRLLVERDEKLGRRFGDASFRFATEVWIRSRAELLAKIRNWIAAESFNNAGHTLDELEDHLGAAAASDGEYGSVQKAFQQALAESSARAGAEIAAAHKSENIMKTRRLVGAYEAKFGAYTRKSPEVVAAEEWVRKMDSLRKPSAKPEPEKAAGRERSRWVALLVVLLLAVAGGAVIGTIRWREQSGKVVKKYARGETQAVLLDAMGVKAPPAPAVSKAPPRLDDTKRRAAGSTWGNPIDGIQYVWVPEGSFEAGCAEGDALCGPEEKPRRKVSVQGFWIGRTEVTVEAFGKFVRTTGYKVQPHTAADLDGDAGVAADGSWMHPLGGKAGAERDWPAAWLSADDAAAYCAWAGGRLPTAVEWEYAARAGATGVRSWGERAVPAERVANLADEGMMKAFAVAGSRRNRLYPDYFDGFDSYGSVGSFAPNAFGLCDVEGNVWEWCSAEGGAAVARGGSWASAARDVRLSAMIRLPAGSASAGTGCRCAIAP